MTRLSGHLVTSQMVKAGGLEFSTHITEVKYTGNAEDLYILPGFIDTHVHGGGGGDTMDGADGVRTLARFHVQHGTTTLYPATITNPWNKIIGALRGIKEVQAETDPTLPDLPGAHLEGPFISPERLGAQPPLTLLPTPKYLDELLASDVIHLVTLAPEITGAAEAARRFARAGVRVSVGHTVADYDTVRAFIESVRNAGGTIGFTHLYNAMGGLNGRDPGIVGAAFADPFAYSELILDLHHVHSGGFLAAFRAKPDRLHLMTDCIRAGGLGDGKTELGGQQVRVQNGAATLPDGTIAGSTLTLDKALRNAISLGVGLEQTSRMLSEVPARYLGLSDRGSLEVGQRADLVVLDRGLQVRAVYVGGRQVA